MSGRNTDAPWDLPSARLPNWLPRIVEIDTAEATAANDAIMASTNTGGK
jgi:hypothetical protein